MENKKRNILIWTLVLIWMGVIIYFSSIHGEQSVGLSQYIAGKIYEVMEVLAPDTAKSMGRGRINYLLRKQAHVVIYMLLGILSMYALRKNGQRGIKGVIKAFVICVIFATLDEIYQLYVPGREGRYKDVIIDAIGSGIGITGYLIVEKIKSMRYGSIVSK